MGTNYYAIPTLEDELKERICTYVREEDYEKAVELIPKKIHIGKQSSGWKFIFNHNHWKFYSNIVDFRNFLKLCRIYNEYGNHISYDHFWKMVEESSENGIDGEEYYTNWDKYNINPKTNTPHLMLFGVPDNYGEIKEGKYRYSTSAEFF